METIERIAHQARTYSGTVRVWVEGSTKQLRVAGPNREAILVFETKNLVFRDGLLREVVDGPAEIVAVPVAS